MPTEPQPPTLAEVVNRAVDVVDPDGAVGSIADYQRRFEDRDEPVTAIEDLETLAWEGARSIDVDAEDIDPALTMAAAVTVHLGFKRSELTTPDDALLTRAARDEFDGRPPERVQAWLAARGLEPG
jgi:hypothetical protein